MRCCSANRRGHSKEEARITGIKKGYLLERGGVFYSQMKCVNASCKAIIPQRDVKLCSACKQIYCSKRCFVGDTAHRCIRGGGGAIKFGGFSTTVKTNENPFYMAVETPEIQLAYEHVPQGGVIKKEIHEGVTQIIYVELGSGTIEIFGEFPSIQRVTQGDLVVIPSSTYHEVRADHGTALKFSTVYAPPTTH